jgi:hypothetical protein
VLRQSSVFEVSPLERRESIYFLALRDRNIDEMASARLSLSLRNR